MTRKATSGQRSDLRKWEPEEERKSLAFIGAAGKSWWEESVGLVSWSWDRRRVASFSTDSATSQMPFPSQAD